MGARRFRPPPRQRLERLHAAALAGEVRARLGRMRERKLVTAELVDVGVALADPALRGQTRDALDAARAAALGLSPVELVCQCATCREPWTPARGPGRVLVVFEQDRRGPGGTLRVGFLCGDCDGGGDAEAWGRVRRRMREDYPGINEGALVAEAGRA